MIHIAAYALNAAWQAPLVLLLAAVCARLAAPLGPSAAHRVAVAMLLLAVGLPLCACTLPSWSAWPLHGSAGAHVRVGFGAAVPLSVHGLHLPFPILVSVVALYALGVGWSVLRLAAALWQVSRLRAEARPLPESAAQRCAQLCAELRAQLPVPVLCSPSIRGPVVLGALRPALLLPPDFFARVTPADARAALAHELAHIGRHDGIKSLLYAVLALPVAWHPAVSKLGRGVADSRELVCDALAAEADAGKRAYAGSLLRLAHAMESPVVGLGMLDGNNLQRRVHAMNTEEKQKGGTVRASMLAAVFALSAVAAASAGSLHLDLQAAGAQRTGNPHVLQVGAGVMAGNILSRQNPVYPPKAKAEHVQGTCTIAIVISKDGVPQDLHVVKSVRKDIDAASLKAVREWRWRPYLLNGNPVAVSSTVNITYSLQP